MGFSYPQWVGPFYPRGLKPVDRLRFYATQFDTVELDTTFHAAPDALRVTRWRDAVHDDFRFTVKTPRTVTHDAPPGSPASLLAMRRFLDVCRRFDHKLGVVLIQFPPSLDATKADGVRRLIDALPTDIRFATEFRHTSWRGVMTEVLRHHRLALVCAEYAAAPQTPVATTDFLYVRWIGEHDRFPAMDHEEIDPSASLLWWRDQLEALSVHRVWGFFNNDYAGYSVATCRRFQRMLGLAPSLRPDWSPEPRGLFDAAPAPSTGGDVPPSRAES